MNKIYAILLYIMDIPYYLFRCGEEMFKFMAETWPPFSEWAKEKMEK